MSSKIDKILDKRQSVYKEDVSLDELVVISGNITVPIIDGASTTINTSIPSTTVNVKRTNNMHMSGDLDVSGDIHSSGTVEAAGIVNYSKADDCLTYFDGTEWVPIASTIPAKSSPVCLSCISFFALGASVALILFLFFQGI
jgi:hypothetical protein